MRTIANQHHAIRFDDWTDVPDDMGQYLIRFAHALYGCATYQLDSYTLTHGVAQIGLFSLETSSQSMDGYYIDFIDITLPYSVPHVYITPKVNNGFFQRIGNTEMA